MPGRAKRPFGPYPELNPGDDGGDYERLWALAFAGGPRPSLLYAGARILQRAGAPHVSGRLVSHIPQRGRAAAPGPLVVKSVHCARSLEWVAERFRAGGRGGGAPPVRRDLQLAQARLGRLPRRRPGRAALLGRRCSAWLRRLPVRRGWSGRRGTTGCSARTSPGPGGGTPNGSWSATRCSAPVRSRPSGGCRPAWGWASPMRRPASWPPPTGPATATPRIASGTSRSTAAAAG